MIHDAQGVEERTSFHSDTSPHPELEVPAELS